MLLAGCKSDHQAKWPFLYSEALRLFEQGEQLNSALEKLDQGLRESAKIDDVWNWKFRVLKAEILLWQSHEGQVPNLLAGQPPDGLPAEFGVRIKLAQALFFVDFERYTEAEGRLKEAEDLVSASATHMMSEVFLCRGLLDLRQKRFPLAEDQFLKAVQFARQNQQRFIEAKSLANLGLVSTKTDRFDQAIDRFSESLSFARSFGYKQIEYVSVSNLAWSYLELGDLEKAISSYSEEEKVIESFGIPQLKEDVYSNLGSVHFAKGNYSTATEYFEKAYAKAREIRQGGNSKQEFSMADALNSLAEIALEEGRLDAAEQHSRQALTLKPQQPEFILTSAKIAIAREPFGNSDSILKGIINDSEATKTVRWQAQAELANLYAVQNQIDLAKKEFRELIETFESTRSSILIDENRMAFSFRATRVYNNYVSLLIAQKEDIEALQIADFNHARTLAEGLGLRTTAHPAELRLSNVQSILRQYHKVVFAYRLAPKKSFLWVITPTAFRLFTLPSRDEIAKQIDQYKKALLGPDDTDESRELGQKLYQALVQPAESLVPRDGRVVLVLDGPLNQLNFETLSVPGATPHYWIEDVEVENASSLLLFTRAADRQSVKSDKLLLIGDPVLNNEYRALVHARDEIELVAAQFAAGDKEVIVQGKATPSAYKAIHPERFPLIHFSTHGIASETSPLESAIILSPEGENAFKLYARSIIHTPLNADLVTISACSGAGTRAYSGEGLVGLAWGFLRAGAHHVIAGLWDVDDASGPKFMDNFYRELRRTKSPASALRSAKRDMLHSDTIYKKPYYWASLQLYTGS